MIHICNWLLTRKCNLSCSYCGIARDKEDKPDCYPSLSYLNKNEMSTKFIKNVLSQFKEYNENCFHIFYGGEPFLRKDLYEIINFCNEEDIHYTIISNNTEEIQNHIRKNFINKVDKISGFTASVDPIIYDSSLSDDIRQKSIAGYNGLINMKEYCNDLVAEVTVTNENKKYLYDLVSDLHDHGITSSITFIDNAKTVYYDFSNIYDDSILVHRDKELENIFDKIINNDLNVHMSNQLLPRILDSLPSDYDCELEKNLHNVTIDSDGVIRLCLRIRGDTGLTADKLFLNKRNLWPPVESIISWNKEEYCKKCNWTCVIMSKLLEENVDYKDLVHYDRR